MKKQLYFLISIILMIGSFQAHAQTYRLAGTVYDQDGPLPGVAVIVQGSTVGTMTDDKGRFSIKAQKGDKLIFQMMGFKDIEYIVVKENTKISITFTETTQELDQVIITALGTTQRKISNLAAVTSIDAKLLDQPTTSISNLLGGRVAGVISSLTSGEPGKNIAEFWIRGIGTFGANSSALVLIDGLEGDINSIDPSDIENFSVLKDASATAVYGVRGANGVVLITTKRGSTDKVRITGRVSTTLSHLRRLPDYVGAYDYATLANEAREVRGEEPLYSNVEMDIIRNNLDPDLYPDVNWQKEIVKNNSWKRAYYVSAQGGAKAAKYFLSLSVNQEDAAYKVDHSSPYAQNVGYDTYGFRSNIDMNLTPTTKLYFGSTGHLAVNRNPGVANTDYIWSAQANIHPLRLPTVYSNGQLPGVGQGAQTSPYVMINRLGKRLDTEFQSKTTVALEQDLGMITKGLRIRAQGAFDYTSWFSESRHVQPELYEAVSRTSTGELVTIKRVSEQAASYNKTTNNYRKYHFESTLNYDRLFGKDHRVSGLVYYYMSDDKYSSESVSNMSAIPKRYQGISSRLTYGYSDTYLIDLNFGYTGSENFQKGRRFGFFPSVAVGWVPTQYKFMKDNLPWLNFFKVRASYGTVGNDRISSKRFPYLTIVNRGTTSPWGSASAETLWETYTGADNLKWEVATKFDLGFEGTLFVDKVDFVLDFFNDVRDGIFQERQQVPLYVGLMSRPYSNIGKMRSYGADGNVSFKQKIGSDMNLTLRANFTYSKNDVKNWEESNPAYPYQERSGYPYGVVRGYYALGLFKDQQDIDTSPVQTFGEYRPGDIKYRDVNGDGRIDSDDRVPIAYGLSSSGAIVPILMYGFGGEFQYKKLSIGVLFKGTGNSDFFYGGAGYIPFASGRLGNVLAQAMEYKNRWIPKDYAEKHGIPLEQAENPDAIYPRLTYGSSSNNTQTSTFWKGNGRYLRLQEITINYNWSAKFMKKIGLQSADLQLVGNNLAVWSPVKIFDPEQAQNSGRAYPIPVTFTFQVYLHF